MLHLSLRDISVNVILASQNIVDDVEHCLKANTSLHLAETALGNRDFIGGTIVDVLDRKVQLDPGKARIFSPFGLGILDIAVSRFRPSGSRAVGHGAWRYLTSSAIPSDGRARVQQRGYGGGASGDVSSRIGQVSQIRGRRCIYVTCLELQ